MLHNYSLMVFTGRLLKAGNVFTGVCNTEVGLLLFNRPLSIVIQTVHRSPVFSSQAVVKGFFSFEYESQVYSTAFDGRFVYATRQLEVSFVDTLTNHIVIECVFLQGDDDHLHCQSYTEAAEVKLSTYILRRA